MRYIFSAALVAILLAVAPSAQAQGFNFKAGLSGDQEVPPIDTATTGRISLKFDSLLSEARYDLHINDGELITQAHLHCAPAGTNGPAVAFLFNGAPVPGPGGIDVDGRLERGVLTNLDIIPTDCGGSPINNIASLLAAVRDGNIYVNVHSELNPPGVVRGQIFDRCDHDDWWDEDDDNGED